MKKSWGLVDKILSGQKTIESRWYLSKSAPWDRVKAGEVIYFKNSGEPVTVSAEVEKVLQFSDLTPGKVSAILSEYANADGIGDKVDEFYELFKSKKYCMLIFLKSARKVTPFNINKKGFGAMCAGCA